MMSKKKFGFLIFTLMMLFTWFMIAASVRAGHAVSGRPTSFETIPPENAVHLEWDAGDKLDTAGFARKRDRISPLVYLSDPGSFIALAQDDPPIYPGPEPIEDASGESLDATEVDANTDLEAPIENREILDYPVDIETNHYPADSLPIASNPEIQNTKPAGSLAGMIYLWMAFIAAVVILTAAVMGAILLYTRQRTKG
jgi:hypothetical protein